MIGFIILLFVILCIVVIIRGERGMYNYDDGIVDDEVTTTTVTTTTTQQPNTSGYTILGPVTRFEENGVWYVIDPADRAKIEVNPQDDLYRDANGGVWELK